MSFGIFKKNAGQTAPARNAGVFSDSRPRTTHGDPSGELKGSATRTLRVGDKVTGTDVVPADYKTVNRYFRGTIIEFERNGVNDTRVKMDGTKRVLRVQKKYLQLV